MSLLDSLFGAGAQASILGSSSQANNAYNQAYNNYQSQGQMMSATAYNNLLAQQQYNANRQSYDWVWNGRPVSITEFAELAYGDTAQKTMFLLKHSTKKEK